MRRLLLSVPFAILVGCASSSEDTSTAPSNLGSFAADSVAKGPSLLSDPAPSLSAQAEARWRENEQVKTVLAGSVLAVSIDDGPAVFLEEDQQHLQLPDVPSSIARAFVVATQGGAPLELEFDALSPDSSVRPGTLQCAATRGKMTITLDGESMKSDPAQCSLTFERSYNEVFPVGFVSGALPSRLHVGSIHATVAGPSGATHEVNVGFIIAERRF